MRSTRVAPLRLLDGISRSVEVADEGKLYQDRHVDEIMGGECGLKAVDGQCGGCPADGVPSKQKAQIRTWRGALCMRPLRRELLRQSWATFVAPDS